MSIFPGTGSQNEFFPMRPPAAFSNGELEGRSPSKMQGGLGEGAQPTQDDILILLFSYYSISRYTSYTKMFGPSVFPDSRVEK